MTKIIDLIQRDLYTTDIILASDFVRSILDSKIFTSNQKIRNKLASSDVGTKINIPYVNPDTYSEPSIMDDTTDRLNVDKITKGEFDARINYYAKSWGWSEIASQISAGIKPEVAIGMFLGEYWGKDIKTKTLAMLKGISQTDTTLDVTSENRNLDFATLIDGLDIVGDSDLGKYASLVVHSRVKNNIIKNDNNPYKRVESENGIVKETYNGLELLVDDSLPVEADGNGGFNYTSYIVRNGAVVFEKARLSDGLKSLEYSRDPFAGNGGATTAIISRMGYLLHPNGFNNKTNPEKVTGMTVAEFETASNWVRVVSKKQAPTITIITKG